MNPNTLILISIKPVVTQIFTLICKKLNIELQVVTEPNITNNVDMIIIDSDFISEKLNTLKTNCKLIGIISKFELPYEIANDFIIPIPFLPSVLEEILAKQIIALKERKNAKVYVKNIESDSINDINNEDEEALSLDYLNDFGDSFANDESIVQPDHKNDGGILDKNQLDEIGDLLNSNKKEIDNNFVEIEDSNNNEDWQDLSDIVDQAINEANTINTIATSGNTIDLKLNDYQLEELTPLLNLLDQNVIDKITKGDEIRLNLRFEDEDE
jgi:hypothetical protein